MSQPNTSLDRRIESCRDLLDVFQQERQMLQVQQRVEPASIVDVLQRKLRLVDAMAEHQQAMTETPVGGDEALHRERVRELATLLERLLVIERENQLLLRRLLDPTHSPGGTLGALPPRTAPAAAPTITPLASRLQQIRGREARPSPSREIPRHAQR